jgi:uncharacterized membrane protein YhdT
MDEFLAVALGFPTVCFTVPLGLMVIYWITVTLGILDVDALGGADASAGVLDAAAGKMEGALDAAAGKLEGVLDAAAGKVEGAFDAVSAKAEVVAQHVEAADTPVVALLSALRLRRAPVTVVLTVLFLVAWLVAFMGTRHLAPHLPLPGWLSSVIVFVVALLVAWPVCAMVTFPMGPLYSQNPAVTHAELVGKRVLVSTSRVTETFGEAELADGGAGLLLQVRCGTPNELAKGKEALLVAWHADRDYFDVEPMEALLDERRAG